MKSELRIDIPEARLVDLRRRLEEARFAADFANDDWRYGTNGAYLAELVAYWRDHFDWRAQEAKMNEHANFLVELEGVPIHFIHERGVGPDPMPLVLTHGWPWTFWDFRDVIGPLSDPAAHGGDPGDAFHVVVPSLPGFGFSSPLEVPGVTFSRTADLWAELMGEVLGYGRFAAQGGDWGALVTAQLGHKYADRVIAIHESLPGFPGFDYTALSPDDYGPGEEDWLARMQAKSVTIASHMAVHSTDPQTLAYALNDSPVGLLAWIVERRRAWSDCRGDVESRFSRDDLLTLVSLYWLTETIGSSLRFYYENAHVPWTPAHDRQPIVEVPTAFAVFPEDVLLLPRSIAERRTNLQRWTVMKSGGHFAPAEEPAALVDDLRSFLRPLR
ncbi:MAG: epoxide hydrolase [Myxococcales bacterium]|nr:epoxide hydrolase [Myxococcales bacterium]